MTDENKVVALEKIKEAVLQWQNLVFKQGRDVSKCWPDSAIEALRILFPKGLD